MRVGSGRTFGAVLRACRRDSRKLVVDALAGRTIHDSAFLWRSTYDRLASAGGLPRQSEASQAAVAADGTRGDLPKAAIVTTWSGAPHLSLPSPRSRDYKDQSGLELRYYLHSIAPGVYLSGSYHGLVQSLRPGLGSLAYDGIEFLHRGSGLGFAESSARDIQFGPGSTVYKHGIHGLLNAARNSDQHGWAWPCPGQRFRGAVVAHRQVRRSLPERLPERPRGDRRSVLLLRFLQSPAPSSGLGLSNTGSRLSGDAMIWTRPRSRLVGHPGAIYFAPRVAVIEKKEKACGKCRLYGNPQKPRIPTETWKSLRLSHISHRPYWDIYSWLKGSTLDTSIIGPKDGEASCRFKSNHHIHACIRRPMGNFILKPEFDQECIRFLKTLLLSGMLRSRRDHFLCHALLFWELLTTRNIECLKHLTIVLRSLGLLIEYGNDYLIIQRKKAHPG